MRIDAALLAVREAGEPPFEWCGQCFDALVQAIEHRHLARTGALPVSRRLGDLQRWVDRVEDAALARGFAALRLLGKEAVTRQYPEPEVASRFLDATVAWLRSTGWPLPDYVCRVRYRPHEINQTGFEWSGRYRSVRVMHGSVTRASADLLVLTAEIGEDGGWSGQALGAVALQLGLGPPLRRLFGGDGLEAVVRLPQDPAAPFGRVVVIGIPSAMGALDASRYHVLARAMRTALRAEESWTGGAARVSCSLLGGNRLACSMTEAAGALVESARQWLRTSETGQELQLVLLNASEVGAFSAAMDASLGRAVERIRAHAVADPLRLQLLESLGALPPDLRKAAEPLRDAIDAPDGLTVELVCTFARAFAEQLVHRVSRGVGIQPSGELLRAIERLREEGHISPWIASYLHLCRIVGNKSVHPPQRPPVYVPDRLLTGDLVAVMAAVQALCTFVAEREASAGVV